MLDRTCDTRNAPCAKGQHWHKSEDHSDRAWKPPTLEHQNSRMHHAANEMQIRRLTYAVVLVVTCVAVAFSIRPVAYLQALIIFATSCGAASFWPAGVTLSGNSLVVNPAEVSIALYAGITIHGTVGYSYGIEYATNLQNATWNYLTNITLAQPVEIWVDTTVSAAERARRFYRVTNQ